MIVSYRLDRLDEDLKKLQCKIKVLEFIQTEINMETSDNLKDNLVEEGLSKTIDWYLTNTEWLNNVTRGTYQQYYEEMYHKK